jgi:hypothetical protein
MMPNIVEMADRIFDQVELHLHDAALLFFSELFFHSPALRDCFPDDAEDREDCLSRMIRAARDALRDNPASHGVEDEADEPSGTPDARAFETAFLSMLEGLLGHEMTPDAHRAWDCVQQGAVRAMMETIGAPRQQEGFFARIIGEVMATHYGPAMQAEARGAAMQGFRESDERPVFKLP